MNKKYLTITFLLYRVLFSVFSEVQDDVLYIRDCYLNINQNQERYDKTEYRDIGLYRDISPDRYSMESTGIYNLAVMNCCKYSENGSVKKMVLTFRGPKEILVSEYYIWEGRLVFVFKTRTSYLKPQWSDDFKESEKVISENRFYIKNNALIKWINEKKQVITEQADLEAKEKTLIHDYLVYQTIHDADIGPLGKEK